MQNWAVLNFVLCAVIFVSIYSHPTENAWAFVKPNAVQAAAIMSFGGFILNMLICQCYNTSIRCYMIDMN